MTTDEPGNPGSQPWPPPSPPFAHAEQYQPHTSQGPAVPGSPHQQGYSPDGRWWWNGVQWVPVQPISGGKNRVTAAVLAILLGDFGAHKFYLDNPVMGVLYLVFFWTFIPGLIGLVEGIIYLTMSDQDFAMNYGSGQGYIAPPQAPLVAPPPPSGPPTQ